MHPAFSIIFFTSAAGAGYGLLALVGLLVPLEVLPVSRWFAAAAIVLGVGLITAGLLSSTLHLGHPERAWRAVSQWRSSWLAREGVASLLTYVPIAVFAVTWVLFGSTGTVAAVSGALVVVGAILTVGCTGMIYASLKPIRQWHNAWVVPNYFAIAIMAGAVFLNALLHLWEASLPPFDAAVAGLIAVSALLKEAYWAYIGSRAAGSTSASATGLGRIGQVRFLESPHTEENYLLKEMGFHIGRMHARRLRVVARTLGFGLPLLATVAAALAPPQATSAAAVIAALSVAAGVLAERWLFFAEAKHTVTLYYGAAAV